MPEPAALAFDVYGTLVDPIGISEQLEEYLSEDALEAGRGGPS
jgi:hypothetical protein